jgi:molybdopterin-guanine dinucleotide biosynthesis protein A
MGRPKASLILDGRTLLQRTLETLQPVTSPVVIAAGQNDLPINAISGSSLILVHDAVAQQGPLAGVAAAYPVLVDRAEIVFICSCDLPLLKAGFVARVCELVGEFDAAVPEHGGRRHPLAAAYRVAALAKAAELLAGGEHRAMAWIDALKIRRIGVDLLAGVDPELQSLRNVNTPQDYAALVRGG